MNAARAHRSRRLPVNRVFAAALFAAALFAGPAAVAPAAGQAAPARQDLGDRLLDSLDLTGDQRAALRQLRAALQAQVAQLRDQVDRGGLAAEEGRRLYHAAMDAYRGACDSVLTGAQQDLLKRARRQQREQQLSEGRPDPRLPVSLAGALHLSPEQRRRWLALLKRQRDQVQQLRAEGREPTPEDLHSLREQHRIGFESILTPDQRLQLEQLRQDWHHGPSVPQEEDRPESDLFDGTDDPDSGWGAPFPAEE